MKINNELFKFPFESEKWQEKFLVAGLIILATYLFFPVGWLLRGYGLEIMRQTARGENPTLPKWDNLEDKFVDGLKLLAIQIVYFAPVYVLLIILIIIGAGGGITLMNTTPDEQTMGMIFGGMYLLFFIAMGIITLVSLPLMALSMVAQTRLAVYGTLQSALDFKAVWRLLKDGLGHYLLAMAVWYGVTMGLSLISSFLMYTVVLICLIPFVMIAAGFYSMALLNSLLGMAYHETMLKQALEEEAPALEPSTGKQTKASGEAR